MTDNIPEIKTILSALVSSTASIQAAAVMTRDGIPIASRLDKKVDSERLSAISASLLSLADTASKDLDQGDLEQVLIFSSEGFILMLKVGANAVLSVVSKPNSHIGMMLHEAKQSSSKLAGLVDINR